MPDRSVLALTARLVAWKVRSGLGAPALIVVLAGLTGLFWIQIFYRAGLAAFFFFSPYVFLFSTADLVWSDSASGALESPLFLHGRFRSYLMLKAPIVSALSAGEVLAFFFVLGAVGLARGEFGARDLVRFLAALAVGAYYAALGGLLGTWFKAGSNVLVVLLAQAAALAAAIAAASSHSDWLGILDPGPMNAAGRLRFAAVTTVFPNLTVSPGRHGYAVECLALAILAFAGFVVRVRGRELGR
jgi:hypothetical protein